MTTPSYSLETLRVSDFKPIRNRYTQARGEPVMYKIFCARCSAFLFVYQKDGPGQLLRCYRDRIHFPVAVAGGANIVCQCTATIGTSMIYKPEKRPAFRMWHGTYRMVRGEE